MKKVFVALMLVTTLGASGCLAEPSGPIATPLPSAPPSSPASTAAPTEAPTTATPGPSLAPSPSATARPAAADSFEGYRWTQAAITVNDHTLVSAIADTPVGLIAAGVNVEFPSLGATFAPSQDPLSSWYSVVVWTSPDGRAWTQEPDSAQFGGGRPREIAALGSTVLMFGIGGFCLPDACSGLPPNGGTIVWATSDGHAWERLVETGLEDGAVMGVTVVDGGLVAVGYVANDGSKPDEDQFTDPTDAAVWRSSDGFHWDLVPDLPVADSLSSIRSSGSNLIAIGSKGYDSLVVWTSDSGGDAWSEGPAVSDFWNSIALAPDGRVVVVTDTNGDRIDGVIYARPDPIDGRWRRSQPGIMNGYRPAQVVWAGASFVVFGWTVHRDGALAFDDEQQTFASADGIDWVPTDLPSGWEGQAPVSVIEHQGDLVALLGVLDTLNGPPTDIGYTMWTGTVPD